MTTGSSRNEARIVWAFVTTVLAVVAIVCATIAERIPVEVMRWLFGIGAAVFLGNAAFSLTRLERDKDGTLS